MFNPNTLGWHIIENVFHGPYQQPTTAQPHQNSFLSGSNKEHEDKILSHSTQMESQPGRLRQTHRIAMRPPNPISQDVKPILSIKRQDF